MRAAPSSARHSGHATQVAGTAHILAWHTTGASKGPTEAVNLLIEEVKRSGLLGR